MLQSCSTRQISRQWHYWCQLISTTARSRRWTRGFRTKCVKSKDFADGLTAVENSRPDFTCVKKSGATWDKWEMDVLQYAVFGAQAE